MDDTGGRHGRKTTEETGFDPSSAIFSYKKSEIKEFSLKVQKQCLEDVLLEYVRKTNGEIDLLGINDNILIAFECKLNETTFDDIKDFLGTSENLFFKVRSSDPTLKLRRVIIAYDGSKLIPDGYSVISINSIASTDQLIKTIGRLTR